MSQQMTTTVGFVQQFIERAKQFHETSQLGTVVFDAKLSSAISMLNGNRFDLICDELKRNAIDDDGELLEAFAMAWFDVVTTLRRPSERVKLINFLLHLLSDQSLKKPAIVRVHRILQMEVCLASMTNSFQLSNLKFTEILAILTIVEKPLLSIDDEVTQSTSDAMIMILHHVSSIETVMHNGSELKGSKFVHNYLNDLITNCDGDLTNILAVIRDCGGATAVCVDWVADHLKTMEMIEDAKRLGIISVKLVRLVCKCSDELAMATMRKLFVVWCRPLSEEIFEILLPVVDAIQLAVFKSVNMAKTIIKILKLNHSILHRSVLAFIVAFTFAQNPRYRSEIVNEIKKTLMREGRIKAQVAKNSWMRQQFSHRTSLDDIQTMIATLLKLRTDLGRWYSLIQDAPIHIAYALIKNEKSVRVSTDHLTGLSFLGELAQTMLIESIACQLSDQAINRHLVDLSTFLLSNAEHTSSLLLINVMYGLVKRCRMQILSRGESGIQQMLAYVPLMTQSIAVPLVSAILPLVMQRASLRSELIKTMRDAMLQPMGARMAVPILMRMLRAVTKKPGGGGRAADVDLSQTFATFSSSTLDGLRITINPDSALSVEVIGCLKRSLTQPAATRALLYGGLADVCMRDEALVGPSLDLLLTHGLGLRKLGVDNYICRNDASIREPLAHLLQAVCRCARKAVTMSRSTSTQTRDLRDDMVGQAMELISRYRSQLVDHELVDIHLDKTSDFSDTLEGRCNVVFANQVAAVVDILIEYTWYFSKVFERASDMEKMAILLKRKNELHDLLKEKDVGKTKKGKNKRKDNNSAIAVDLLPVFIRLETLAQLVQSIIRKPIRREVFSEELEENWTEWLMEAISKRVSALKTIDAHEEGAFDHLISIASGLAVMYKSDRIEWQTFKTAAIVGLHQIIAYIGARNSTDRLRSGFYTICTDILSDNNDLGLACVDENRPANSQKDDLPIGNVIIHFQNQFRKFLNELLSGYEEFIKNKAKPVMLKRAMAIVQTIRLLSNFITDVNSEHYQFVLNICLGFVKSDLTKETSIAREIWRLYLEKATAKFDVREYAEFFTAVAKEMSVALQDDPGDRQYLSLNDATVGVVLGSMIGSIEDGMRNIRTTVGLLLDEEQDDPFVPCCKYANQLAKPILALLDIHLDHTQHKEALTAMLSRMYETWSTIVKALLLLHRQKKKNIVEWKSLAALTKLVNGRTLQIMEATDENVGILKDGQNAEVKRKYHWAIKVTGIYVGYARNREAYHSNLILLGRALHMEQLHVNIQHGLKRRIREVKADDLSNDRIDEDAPILQEPDENEPPKKR